jgi:hypothetical protein
MPAKTINVYMLFSDNSEEDHKKIITLNRLNIDHVLGGGFIGYDHGYMKFNGNTELGTVPNKLIKGPIAEQIFERYADCDYEKLRCVIAEMLEPGQGDILKWEKTNWNFH